MKKTIVIEEIETLEIDFKDTYELELALEVSSKKQYI